MSLETLSGARRSSRPAPSRRQPCGGGRDRQLGNPSGLPGDPRRPLPAPPPAGPAPSAGAPASPPRPARPGPDGGHSHAPAAARRPDGREALRRRPRPSLPVLPARALGPSVPRFPLGRGPRGARPDPVTRAAGTARTAACPPSLRARRGRARQEPGRDAPALQGVPGPRHLLSGEGRCREGEEAGAAVPEGPAPDPKGRQRAPPPGVLVPNSEVEVRGLPSIQKRQNSRKPVLVQVDL